MTFEIVNNFMISEFGASLSTILITVLCWFVLTEALYFGFGSVVKNFKKEEDPFLFKLCMMVISCLLLVIVANPAALIGFGSVAVVLIFVYGYFALNIKTLLALRRALGKVDTLEKPKKKNRNKRRED